MSFEANGFQLGDKFGEGVFGETFLGRLQGADAPLCAIKRLGSMAIDRGHVSAVLTRLGKLKEHPGIVKIVDWSTASSPSWIASEFQGSSSENAPDVSAVFGAFRTEEDAFALLSELATTLGAFHSEGIVHGNLHPGNIFMAPDGSPNRCRIADFGQAFIGAAHHVPLTPDSLRTLPPEQLLRPEEYQSQSAFRWDVYAFGVLAYRILTGVWPRGQGYIDAYHSECEAHHGGSLPLDANRFVESLVGEESVRWFDEPASEPCQRIREVIADCLALHPDSRPRTGGDIQIRLSQIAHDIETARAERRFAAERKTLKRKLLLTRSTVLILVSTLTLATLYGITTLHRALTAERTVDERSGYLTALGASVAETNGAYGESLDKLWKSREAADQFFHRLVRQEPLSSSPMNPLETEGDWLALAKSYYGESLGDVGASWNSDLEAARGHHNLAHAALALGDNSGALDHFSKAVQLLEPLAGAAKPGDLHAELFVRLGDCHRQLWIQEPVSWTDKSLSHLDRSAEAYVTAMESRPDDSDLILNAAAAYFYLGLHEGECRLQREALDSYSRSLELLSLVEKLRPARLEDRFLAARAYSASGALLKEANRGPAALDAQVLALGILLALTEESPQKAEFEIELARCYCELGELFQSVTNDESAPDADPFQMFNEANRILLAVLSKSPSNPRATVGLARTYMGQSKLNRRKDKTTEAIRLAKQAVGLLTDLVAKHPENRQFPFQLAHHKVEYMQLLAAVAKSQDAIKLGEEASVTLELLLDEQQDDLVVEPVLKDYQLALADLHEQLGTLTEKARDTGLAAAHYSRAIGYWELLAANYTTEKKFGLRLAASRDMLKRVSP